MADFTILHEVAPELKRKSEDELAVLWRDFVNNELLEEERRWLLVPLDTNKRQTLQAHFAAWWDDKKAGRRHVRPSPTRYAPEEEERRAVEMPMPNSSMFDVIDSTPSVDTSSSFDTGGGWDGGGGGFDGGGASGSF